MAIILVHGGLGSEAGHERHQDDDTPSGRLSLAIVNFYPSVWDIACVTGWRLGERAAPAQIKNR